MNCKPGDLAIRIQGESGDLVPVGAVVRCVRHYSGPANIDNVRQQFTGWFVEYQGHVTDADGWTWAIPDEHLRPIRDPGDDAKDETLQWLPVPSTQKEGA